MDAGRVPGSRVIYIHGSDEVDVKVKDKKPKGKVKAWLERQKVAVKVWLYRRALLAGLGFVGLNAVDGYLTNYATHLASSSGVMRAVEANPFLAPIAGHWALSFKGVLGLVVIGGLAWWKKSSPQTLFLMIMGGCVIFLGVVIWNLCRLGML
ncbi:DUF5658 family protein [Candidatus Magnetobacterium casense]|uniref:DUF5658 domain-containing protein n=1 Tax=Candidatus Magnetobacterium casense TaxID=1455061 RepID=A0ABS6RX67_9BACT|nr:DUF5658 family protein [Candidatus Magnetobacterium casensis]MBV6341218.1 hypothetical protein [Candidatus Magnetobacterium casensis]